MRQPWACVLLVSLAAGAAEPADKAVTDVANEYLRAATGQSSSGKELLLGGVTMSADLLQLDNAQIVSTEPVRHEEASLASATGHMKAMDTAGHHALAKMMGGVGGNDLQVKELTKEEAMKLLGPTKEAARAFAKELPVLAYAIRVDKEVYWHPKNPIRALLQKVGGKGSYVLDLYLFKIRSLEGPNHFPREWPLRVLRFRSGKTDTGWKILPASDWNPE